MERLYELVFPIEVDGKVDEGALRAEVTEDSEIHQLIARRVEGLIEGYYRVRSGRVVVPDGRPATRRIAARDRRDNRRVG